MKKIFSILVSVVATALFFTSCEKNSLIDNSVPNSKDLKPYTITAGIDLDAQTKTALGDKIADTPKQYKVVWSADDEIAVKVSGSDDVYKFTLSSGAGEETANFTCESFPTGATITSAVYPFFANASIKVPTNQTPILNGFDPKAAIMESTPNSEGKLQFKHKAAYVKVTTGFSCKTIGIMLGSTSYYVQSSSDNLLGSYYIAVPADNNSSSFILQLTSNSVGYTNTSANNILLSAGKIQNLGTYNTIYDFAANHHGYVDLGLSSGTLWATCNVGASKPEEIGQYFAWGDRYAKTTQTEWSWSNYKFGTSTNLTKYNDTDNLVSLELSDDMGKRFGLKWSTPTQAQCAELVSECTWESHTLNGVEGWKVTSKKEGNSNYIFLPKTGYKEGSDSNLSGAGMYWTSSLSDTKTKAHCLKISSSSQSTTSPGDRYLGYCVRPVMNKID